jgi:glycerophosphoryl diester phosphodiesterase
VQVYGHRGSRRPGPENTATAIDAALRSGADGVEIDVRAAADGLLVCCHDPAVRGLPIATTAGPVLVEAGLTCLAQALDAAAGRGRVICEVKNVAGEPGYDGPAAGVALALVALLAARAGAGHGGADDVVVSSFDWFSLEAVRTAEGPPTAFLAPPGVALSASAGYAAGRHSQLHPHVSDVLAAGAQAVEGVRRRGLAVVAWTVTSAAQAGELAGLGVDGVICDEPSAITQ